MAQESMALPHSLTLTDRRQLSMTGVREVISFDENAVLLRTELGELLIQGNELHLKSLSPDNGLITVEGNVAAMTYNEPRQTGWLRRVLK